MKNRSEKPTSRTYGEWQGAYDVFNRELFKNELPPCIITLQRKKNSRGYFSPSRFTDKKGKKVDEIAINPEYFVNRSLEEILSTLVHEMTHQWQHHNSEKSLKTYHNKEWSRKMMKLGLIPSDTGKPGGKITGQRMSHYINKEGHFLEVARFLIVEKHWQVSYSDRFTSEGKIKEQENLSQLTDAELELTSSGYTDDLIIEKTRATKTNSDKTCFVCLCGNKLWGKSTLNVACCDCGSKFENKNKNKKVERLAEKEEKEKER